MYTTPFKLPMSHLNSHKNSSRFTLLQAREIFQIEEPEVEKEAKLHNLIWILKD